MEVKILVLLCFIFASECRPPRYEVTIITGDKVDTTKNIKLKLYGTNSDSEEITMPHDKYPLTKNSVKTFVLNVKGDLGIINKVIIQSDGSWYLKEMKIHQEGHYFTSIFPVHKWFKDNMRRMQLTRRIEGKCGITSRPRVIGGEKVFLRQWPWMVELQNEKNGKKQHLCSGVLVHPEWVITAAHCVKETPKEKLHLVFGEHDLSKPFYEEHRDAAEVIIHPKFKHNNNDIALVRINKAVLLGSFVNLVCLPTLNEKVTQDSQCYVAGWGSTSALGGLSNVLRHAKLPIVSNKDCSKVMNKVLPSPITDSILCAGGNGKGSCHGDSGSPFMCMDKLWHWRLQGIVTGGDPMCDATKTYSVFTRTSMYMEWIDQHIYSKYLPSQ